MYWKEQTNDAFDGETTSRSKPVFLTSCSGKEFVQTEQVMVFQIQSRAVMHASWTNTFAAINCWLKQMSLFFGGGGVQAMNEKLLSSSPTVLKWQIHEVGVDHQGLGATLFVIHLRYTSSWELLPFTGLLHLYDDTTDQKRSFFNIISTHQPITLLVAKRFTPNFVRLHQWWYKEQDTSYIFYTTLLLTLTISANTRNNYDHFQVVVGIQVFYCLPMPVSNWPRMCCHGRRQYLKGVHRLQLIHIVWNMLGMMAFIFPSWLIYSMVLQKKVLSDEKTQEHWDIRDRLHALTFS